MSYHLLKLLSEAYRNIAVAPTTSYTKSNILDKLETMIEKEVKKSNTEESPEPAEDDEIPV